jgi:hypothetical protein
MGARFLFRAGAPAGDNVSGLADGSAVADQVEVGYDRLKPLMSRTGR